MTNSSSDTVPQPVFLLSAPRSGSTWLMRTLQSHPKICGGEETHFFSMFKGAMTLPYELVSNKPRVGPLTYVPSEEYSSYFIYIWKRLFNNLYQSNPQAEFHLEKSPANVFCINEIISFFPEAKFIILFRDSRGVSASLVAAGRSWGKRWAPASIKRAAIMWYSYNSRLVEDRHSIKNGSSITVFYENMIANTDYELDRIAEFLGVDKSGFFGGENNRSPERSASDPAGFARVRGSGGWAKDLNLWDKIIVWRYTRRLMNKIGYKCSLFDNKTSINISK